MARNDEIDQAEIEHMCRKNAKLLTQRDALVRVLQEIIAAEFFVVNDEYSYIYGYALERGKNTLAALEDDRA